MKKRIYSFILLVSSLLNYSQEDNRQVVGVAEFSSTEKSPYTGLVTEKVVEMLINTKRFRVVDRTSMDKVKAELELQKSEAFMDSKNLVEQDVAVAAEKMITGHITKIPVYAIKNGNGSVRGYKSSVAFQMKVVDVATGLSTESTSFQGQSSALMLSPESSVTEAMKSLQGEIAKYFLLNFPIKAKLLKILQTNGDKAEKILIGAGKQQGIKVGDKFKIEVIEMLEGQPYPTEIGEMEVEKLVGETFSEGKIVVKKSQELVQRNFSNSNNIELSLIVNKK